MLLVHLLVAAATGAAAGAIGGWVGLPAIVLWVITFPTIFSLVNLRLHRRHGRLLESALPEGTQTVLLEASQHGPRILQTLLPLAGTLVGATGVSLLVREDGPGGMVSAATITFGVVLMVIGLRTVLGWTVTYRGHTIRFENDPCSGERLLIDGNRVATGSVGLDVTMSAPIERGAAAGHRIVATSHAGLVRFSCRIVAFAPMDARTELQSARFTSSSPGHSQRFGPPRR